MAPPGGTEVAVMGVDRFLQSMTSVEAMAGSIRELPALLFLYNGLYSMYCIMPVSFIINKAYSQDMIRTST